MNKVRHIIESTTLPNLFFAGRALLTFVNTDTKNHITVKVKQMKDRDDRSKKLPIYSLSIRMNGDGENGYVFAGSLFKDTLRIKWGKEVVPHSTITKISEWLIGLVKNPQLVAPNLQMFHEGICCCCGRTLTNPESIVAGIGPECRKHSF